MALLLASAQGAVIGIDLGARFMKVGIIQPGTGIELVLNEAKLSPSLKDIGTIETKITSLTDWLTLASHNPARFETKPAAVKHELMSVGCSEWEILPVLSGNNFSVEMQEQCEDHVLSVMKSNGSSYS